MTNFIFNQKEFKKSRSRDLISCICNYCKEEFKLKKHYLQSKIKHFNRIYCSKQCQFKGQVTSKTINCKQCNKDFIKIMSQIKKSPNHFCSHSCSAIYSNTHKTKGNRRSKLEIWLEQKLPPLYPNLEFHFNRKDAINSELDIYIPTLKLAFELNGVFHYEPIYGKDKLESIQNNDDRKFQACIERDIELCIIDTSKQSYFKEQSSIKFLEIIKSVINQKLVGPPAWVDRKDGL